MNYFKNILALFVLVCFSFAQNNDPWDTLETNDEPSIDFKDEYLVGINFGSSIPFGTNLKNSFTSGMNFKLNVKTPFGFSLANKEFKIKGIFDLMKCAANENVTYDDYSLTLIRADLTTNISVLNVSVGTGLAMASGTQIYADEDYQMTTALISAGIGYNLPLSNMFSEISMGNKTFDLSSLSISVFLEGVEIFGAPAESGTSDIINLGLGISYPVLF